MDEKVLKGELTYIRQVEDIYVSRSDLILALGALKNQSNAEETKHHLQEVIKALGDLG